MWPFQLAVRYRVKAVSCLWSEEAVGVRLLAATLLCVQEGAVMMVVLGGAHSWARVTGVSPVAGCLWLRVTVLWVRVVLCGSQAAIRTQRRPVI